MRFLFKLFGAIVVLAVVLVIGLFLLPADRLGKLVSEQLTRQLGRQVSLAEARVSIYPVLGVAVKDLTIASPDDISQTPVFRAATAEIGADPMAALQGQVKIHSIHAQSPQLSLISAGADKNNWTFGAPSTESADGSALPEITLDKLVIENGDFRFIQDGVETRIQQADVTVTWPDVAGPLRLRSTLRHEGAPITISAVLADAMAAFAGDIVGLRFDMSTTGGELSFDGLAGITPSAKGAVQLNIANTADFAKSLGQVGINLPKGFGRAIKGTFALTYTDGNIALRDGRFTLDQHQAALGADVKLAAKPVVNANIQASKLDLSAFMGGSDSGTAESGWSKDAIDASAFGSFDGRIAIVTEGLDLGDLQLGTVRVVMTNENSRAVLNIEELRGFGGNTNGSFVVNNRSGLSVRADLKFANIDMGKTLSDLMDVDQLSGMANGNVSLLTSGPSVHSMMQNLDGSVQVTSGPGAIRGFDVAALFAGDQSGGSTEYESASASFDVQNGRMRNDDLTLNVGRFQGAGKGGIDLAPRSMDYLLTITDPKAIEGNGLSIPVRIKGPWSDLTFRVDAAEALEQNLAAEVDKLKAKAEAAVEAEKKKLKEQLKKEEQKARQKVEEKVQETLKKELGVTKQSGQSVEDAIKDSLKKEAEKGLRNLFGN